MNPVAMFFLKNLFLLHKGGFLVKMKANFFMALPLGTVTWCLNSITSWTLSNQDYIGGVMACIAVDHLIGSAYHAFKIRDFTIKKNVLGLLTKVAFCVAAVVLFEIIHNTLASVPLIYEYLKVVTRLIVLLYPAGSAFMNMSALTNGVFPPIGWIKKIKSFNENLDLDKFKETPKSE